MNLRLSKLGIAEFNLEEIRIVVFDVDDTITRGTFGIKKEAWNTLFHDNLDLLQEALELYEYTGKGDRYNIIAHIIEEPQEGCTENSLVQEWAEKFEIIIQTSVRNNGIHEDDLQELVVIVQKFPEAVYLVSATPQASVEENINFFIKKYPELEGAFKEVIGTPFTSGKAGVLQDIIRDTRLSSKNIVMVGDGGSDYAGANGAGTQFVGINPAGREDAWKQDNFPKVSSISELSNLF